MLVPLETLPGWPDVQEPTLLEVLGLLVGAPLVVILVVAVLARVHHAVKGNVGTPAVANRPIWVNGRRIEPSAQSDSSRESIESAHRTVGRRVAAEEEESKGGAGARW
jgi:hypothetical protein